MEKRKVLITGGSRGIGKATAECFRQNGYEVFTPTRDELDLSDRDSVFHYIDSIKHIRFDSLVNCAGINTLANIDELNDQKLDTMVNINLITPMLLIQGVAENMKEQRYGRIVNIGSIWGLVGKPGRVGYSATKHGIHGVTQTLAVELAQYNILINTICPGYTLTDLTFKNNTKEQLDEIAGNIPMGRLAKPEEQAKAIFFLGSENNTYITGQQIAVDGGYSAK